MTIFEFGKWLREHGSSLTEFFEAALVSKHHFYLGRNSAVEKKLMEQLNSTRRPHPIDRCLTWRLTPQGFEYWKKISDTWKSEQWR